MLADRNFDVDHDGRLTGELLHKTDPEVMECFSPFTTVNGAIWPVVEVEPTTYRFRLLNGSNARTYRLVLTRDGEPDHERITQIGTEGGLLLAPVSLPTQGLVLASAERADLLVDFSDLSPGVELTVWNTAAAPFDGTFADPTIAGAADLEGLLPFPEVLRIRVSTATSAPSGTDGAGHRLRAGDPWRARRLCGGACYRPRRTWFRRRGRAADGHPPRARRGPGRRWAGHRRRRAPRGSRKGDAMANGRYSLRGRRNVPADARCARDLAIHQPHRRHPPDARTPRHLPGARTAPSRGRAGRGHHDGGATSAVVRIGDDPGDHITHSASTRTNGDSRTPFGSTPTRSSRSQCASEATPAATCTTATSSSTKITT